MFDLMFTQIPPPEPGKPARCMMTIHADVDALTLLRDGVDQALMGGPVVVETRSASGVETRILIDRLGPAIPRN